MRHRTHTPIDTLNVTEASELKIHFGNTYIKTLVVERGGLTLEALKAIANMVKVHGTVAKQHREHLGKSRTEEIRHVEETVGQLFRYQNPIEGPGNDIQSLIIKDNSINLEMSRMLNPLLASPPPFLKFLL